VSAEVKSPAPGPALPHQRRLADAMTWLAWYAPGIFTAVTDYMDCEGEPVNREPAVMQPKVKPRVRVYYAVHAQPYTPARRFAKGKSDPGFRTKLAIGADLAVGTGNGIRPPRGHGQQRLRRPGRIPRRARRAGLPFVMALKPRRGNRAHGADAYTPADTARALA
jgi:hypothetical protein